MCNAMRSRAMLLRSCRRMMKTRCTEAGPRGSPQGAHRQQDEQEAELARSVEQLRHMIGELVVSLGERRVVKAKRRVSRAGMSPAAAAKQQELEERVQSLTAAFHALQEKHQDEEGKLSRGCFFLAMLALITAFGTAAGCAFVEGQMSSYACALHPQLATWDSVARTLATACPVQMGSASAPAKTDQRSTASGRDIPTAPLPVPDVSVARSRGGFHPAPVSHFGFQAWSVHSPAPPTQECLPCASVATNIPAPLDGTATPVTHRSTIDLEGRSNTSEDFFSRATGSDWVRVAEPTSPGVVRQ